jgi:hypothetical protein
MPDDPNLLIVRADLPTPDVVVVRHRSGQVTVFADTKLSHAAVAEMVNRFDPDEDTGHALH